MEFIKEKPYLVVIIALVIGIIGAHFADASYYHHQMDKEAQQTVTDEANLGVDFSTLMDSTKGQIDCSQFRDKANISFCQTINEDRK